MSERGADLFGAIEARGLASEAVSDAAYVRAMVRAEAALAAVEAEAGLIPSAHARLIGEACLGPVPDVGRLGADAAATGTPVVPLLQAIRATLAPDVAASLHHGATSQDILDTAAMLTASGAARIILADLEAAAWVARRLAADHATTPIVGRTLMQAARPTTFGAKAATWCDGLEAAMAGLARVREARLAGQLGGPVGTLDQLGPDPDLLVQAFATRLGLAAAPAPWHTERSRVAELAGALGTVAAVVAKIALDVVLLAQTEVGELGNDDRERGGSSSMPHKHNPVAAVLARANALRAPGLVAGVLAAASSIEHERAAGGWHAEWASLRELVIATGSAAAWLRETLEHLTVDATRMQRNLEASGLSVDQRSIDAAARVARRVAARVTSSTARAAQLHHVDEGRPDGPVVVLSNSLGSTLAMWDGVVPTLAATHRVIRYDLRGHGGSPTPPGPYAIADLGTDLLALLDRVGAATASLVGSSIGGMASLWAASHAPERIERLAVIGSAARLDPSAAWIDRSRVALRDGTAGIAETVTSRWVAASYAADNPQPLEAFRAMFRAAEPAGYAGCCLAIAGMDLTAWLDRITAPTLVAVGSDDVATPPTLSRALADAIAGARLAIIDGGAHVPALDRPDDVCRLLLEHLP